MTDKKPAAGFDLDSLFSNPEMEIEGVWVDFFGGSRLKIASTDSQLYKARLAKLAKKHRLQLDSDNDESIRLVSEITAEALADTVLLDWERINIDGQKNAKYTKELGKKALLNSSKFRTFVEENAADYSNFQDELKEDVGKS